MNRPESLRHRRLPWRLLRRETSPASDQINASCAKSQAPLNSGNELTDLAGEYVIDHKHGAQHLSILVGGGTHYLRIPREPVTGIPELPDQWASYLKQNLVIGTITQVIEEGCVKMDAGKAIGIELGGVLAVQGRERYGPQRLFVVSVEDECCIAKEPDLGPSGPPLSVGQRVVAQALAR
jgi:hypothetical protein